MIYVLGGVSATEQDAQGEVALLLDALDLVLYTAQATASTAVSNDNSEELSNPSEAALQALAECLAWGLQALTTAAKRVQRSQPCSKMMGAYVLERFVLLASDWPITVCQQALEVIDS